MGAHPELTPEAVGRGRRRDREALREDATNLHGKAQRDKTQPRRVRGRGGALRGLPLASSARPTALTRPSSTWPRSISITWVRTATPPRTTWPPRGATPRGTLTHDALYNAIAALERRALARVRQEQDEAARPTIDKKFTEAMELYIQLYPERPRYPRAALSAGQALLRPSGVTTPPCGSGASCSRSIPSSKFAAGAGELMLDSFNQSKDYANIEAWARRLKTAPSFQARRAAEAPRYAHRAGGLQAGRAEGRRGQPRRGGRCLPARGQGVSPRRAGRAGLRQRRDRGAEGGRHRHDEDRRRPA